MTADLLVVGGGIVGLTAAIAFRRRFPDQHVVILEKEGHLAEHASGRNSGVLHAGFYYTADSLKARLCRDGNRRMAAFCDERGLPIRRSGKLVVARSEADHAGLDELLRRAAANDVPLEAITEAEAREIEPRARTVGRALWSPSTAVVDPGRVVAAMADEALGLGIDLRLGVAYQGRSGDGVLTSAGPIPAGFVLNAAGLYADRVARDFGFAAHHRILPFKGLYLTGDEPIDSLRCAIYPVPDLGFPFLGVHFTVTVEGHAKIGPTAMPALWREAYGGLARFSALELGEIALREARLFVGDASFRALAAHELRKSRRPRLLADAAQLVDGLDPARWTRWGRPGIRAQLLDVRTGKLEMDFLVEGDSRSLHVLNAVSPAFTCSLPFADELVRRVAA